jgi:hypothetical protein
VNANNDIRKLVNQDKRLHAIDDLAAETKHVMIPAAPLAPQPLVPPFFGVAG